MKIIPIIVGLLVLASAAAAADAPPRELCKAYKCPRARVLKPATCTPIRFVREPGAGAVGVMLTYSDGSTFKDSKPVSGEHGQFCYGLHRFKNLRRIDMCDQHGSAWLDRGDLAHLEKLRVPGRDVERDGVTLCLRGTAWCSAHGPSD